MQSSEPRARRPAGLPAAASGAAGSRSLTFIVRRKKGIYFMDAQTNKKCSNRLLWIMIIVAVIFFVIAAACEIKAASSSRSRSEVMRHLLSETSVTPDRIRESVANIIRDKGETEWYQHAGLVFAILGVASLSLGIGFNRSK